MKKFSKIKLNQFSKDELDRRKMNALKGGGSECGCAWCGCVGGEISMMSIDKGTTDSIAYFVSAGYGR